jgi:hypothetical protein
MAALAADTNGSIVGTPVIAKFSANAADTFYRGAIVYIDTAGGAQVTYATGDRPLGISPKNQVIAAAADEVEVLIEGLVWLPVGAAVAAADEGELLIADVSATPTDNPADMVSFGDTVASDVLADNDAVVGRILRVTATQMLVRIGGGWTGALYINIATTPASGYFA